MINGETGDSSENLLDEKGQDEDKHPQSELNWLKRLFINQEHSLLYFMIGTYGADGLSMVQLVAL